MAISPRVPVLGALFVVPLLLVSGCGSEATGARSTLATVQNTSYVVEDPVPTTAPATTQPITGGASEGQIDPNEQQYTVVANDSVSKIANMHGIEATILANYNAWPEGIQHPIFPGDVIKIPPGSKVPGTGSTDSGTSTGGDGGGSTDTAPDSTEAPSGGTETVPNGNCPTTYTIQAGDTSRIKVAEQFDITYEEMDNANVDTPGYSSFIVGTEIKIPCPSA